MTDEEADRLVNLACEWVCRVRDVDPERNGMWLRALSDQDRWELLFAVAAMADPEAPLSRTLGWLESLAVTHE